jgi:hypothetical protein
MEPIVENSAVIAKVAESNELIKRLKMEIFSGEEKNITRKVVHKLLFYFLIALMIGCAIGMFYTNWQTDRKLSLAKKSGIIMFNDGTMFQLTPMTPRD